MVNYYENIGLLSTPPKKTGNDQQKMGKTKLKIVNFGQKKRSFDPEM